MNGALSRPRLAAAVGLLTMEQVPRPAVYSQRGDLLLTEENQYTAEYISKNFYNRAFPTCAAHVLGLIVYGKGEQGLCVSTGLCAGRQGSSGAAGQVSRSEATSVLHKLTVKCFPSLAFLLRQRTRTLRKKEAHTSSFLHITSTPRLTEHTKCLATLIYMW